MIIGQGVVGGPRITDPRGSKPPPPPNHPQITDHPPHNPPPPPPQNDPQCPHIFASLEHAGQTPLL